MKRPNQISKAQQFPRLILILLLALVHLTSCQAKEETKSSRPAFLNLNVSLTNSIIRLPADQDELIPLNCSFTLARPYAPDERGEYVVESVGFYSVRPQVSSPIGEFKKYSSFIGTHLYKWESQSMPSFVNLYPNEPSITRGGLRMNQTASFLVWAQKLDGLKHFEALMPMLLQCRIKLSIGSSDYKMYSAVQFLSPVNY